MAQSPRRSRKAAVPTPSRGGGRRPSCGTGYRCPVHWGAIFPPTSGGGKPPPYTAEPISLWKMATAYQRRHTQVPPYVLYWWCVHVCGLAYNGPPPSTPAGGGGGGHGLRPGVAPSADGAGDDREFRPLRRAGVSRRARRDQRLCLWKPRFGQRAAGWQEVSARNFVSEQGAASPPYWMYGKKLRRSYGAKGPATPADTPVVSCPTEKNRVKLLSVCAWDGDCAIDKFCIFSHNTV